MINFKLETDADGIALVTWDMPGRSMNVLDGNVLAELSDIIEKTTADAAVKGVVITSGKDAFCAGADLNVLQKLSDAYAKTLKAKGEEAAPAGSATTAAAAIIAIHVLLRIRESS